ncbi:MAG TPA: MFS transporter [Candidatus Acidoferrum sp.]|nr:MFS transporter [Candidatus Acidoferrum sp.]
MTEERYSVPKTLFIGLAFCTISIAWSVYNSFVPVFLKELAVSTTAIGFIMTFDNISGLLFQPYFGKLSDKTNTKLGRRMPYLVFGVPAAAVGMTLIPLAAAAGSAKFAAGGGLLASLVPLMGSIILMNFAMSVYRAPAVALMPDATPPTRRSEANGIINLMGGVGSALAFFVGGKLFDVDARYPFWMAGGLMAATVAVMLFFYREPKAPFEAADELEADAPDAPVQVRPKSLYPLLFAVFFWFCAYNAVETFFTLYAIDRLGMTAGEAASTLLYMSGSYLVCAWPAGKLGARFGRRGMMAAGTAVTLMATCCQAFIGGRGILAVVLIAAGLGVALININSYPALIQMSGKGQTGRYTGYYYAFSFSASIASPLLFGLLSDFAGSNSALFFYAAGMYAVSAVCILAVSKKDVDCKGDTAA